MNITSTKSDLIGALAGMVCLLHCIATPFLFIAVAGSANHGVEAPVWWISINYTFLVVAFFAVLQSVKTTSNNTIKPIFWVAYFLLFAVIINEQFLWIHLPEFFSYLAASFLIGVHLYNQKYCQCSTEGCCVD
jgi:hypothetical protein